MNIVQIIRDASAAYPARAAFIERDRSLDYRELLRVASSVADELRCHAVAPAERVALFMEDGIDYVATSLGILEAGAVVVPISPSLSGNEVDTILARMAVHWAIYPAGRLPLAGAWTLEAIGSSPEDAVHVAPCGPGIETDRDAAFEALDPAFIRFSSGTTGASKGVVLSHRSILERTDAANAGLRISQDDVVIWVLSMSFHFVATILLFLRKGATVVLCGSMFPDGVLDGLRRHAGTFVYASPMHYRLLTKSRTVTAETFRNVRMAVSTAVGLSEQDAGEFQQRFGLELSQAYGIIEVGLPAVNTACDPSHRGSVGRLLPDYELDIRNRGEDGSGEIWLRGPGTFDAYFSPWSFGRDAHPDGWFKTGDIGHLDGDGYLWVDGRDGSVINFAGMKIFPEEVEAVLLEHPAIADALVSGVAHATFGHIPRARLVLREGAAFDPEDFRRFGYKHLAPHKVPKEFEVVERLERTASGKLRRV